MAVELKPETERMIQEEISNGHVRSVDELIEFAVFVLRAKHQNEPTAKPRRKLIRLKNSGQF